MADTKLEDLISTTAYAALHGRAPANVRQLLKRGGFKTAVQLGRNWFIDKNEPYPDRRVKSGAYRQWRKPSHTTDVASGAQKDRTHHRDD